MGFGKFQRSTSNRSSSLLGTGSNSHSSSNTSSPKSISTKETANLNLDNDNDNDTDTHINLAATATDSISPASSHSQCSSNIINTTTNTTMVTSTSTSTSTSTFRIGSKSKLVSSPDHKSIQLAPEAPKQFNPKKAQLADSTTTSPIFRNDVRQEWIDAMFGTDFFPYVSTNTNNGNGNDANENIFSNALEYTPPRQGMGLAKIPSYLSYTATIHTQDNTYTTTRTDNLKKGGKESSSSSSSSNILNSTNKENTLAKSSKVGITLSRIPIGVYVRMVDIESEAYAAGVVPGSILIDINGMGVLGEPSHKLLERLWVYEGHFHAMGKKEEMKLEKLAQENGMGGNNIDRVNSTHSLSMSMHGEDKDDNNGVWNKGIIKGPVALTFIKDGQVYTTVLLSGAPFGISWAPCGNFALVQRSYAHAQKAGVRRGCIVAAVNHRSLRDMDHLDTAMTLKEEFNKGIGIRIVCVYTPAASRTHYHERQAGNTSTPVKNGIDVKIIDGVRIRKVVTKKSKPTENPTEYGVGSFFTCGTGANYAPASSEQDHDFIAVIANRVAAGEVAAPTGMKRGMSSIGFGRSSHSPKSFAQMVQLSDKDMMAQQENNHQAKPQDIIRSIVETHKRYSDCPSIEWSTVLEKWDFMDALVFSLRMHAASYNEERFSAMGGVMGGVAGEHSLLEIAAPIVGGEHEGSASAFPSGTIPLHSFEANLNLVKSTVDTDGAADVILANLLQFLALVSSEEVLSSIPMYCEEAEKICGEIIEILVEIAMTDDDLCQNLHFLLRSFSSTHAKSENKKEDTFSPVKILTAAHLLLRNRLVERDNVEKRSNNTMLFSPIPSTSESGETTFDFQTVGSSSTMQSAISRMPNMSFDHVVQKSEKKGMAKRIGKLFRPKSKKISKLPEDSSTDEFDLSAAQSDSLEYELPGSPSRYGSPKGDKKRMNFRPTGILRKAADQLPQDSGFSGKVASVEVPSTANLFESMGWFLSNLDQLCGNVEKSLLKPFSQKFTEWALQPWSDNKGRVLSESTSELRKALRGFNQSKSVEKKSGRHWSPVLNPMDSSELLLSIVPEESYILPSAHFPLLLSFDSCPRQNNTPRKDPKMQMMYRTQVNVVAVRGKGGSSEPMKESNVFIVHAAVGGTIRETGRSTLEPYYGSSTHRWHDCNILQFESRLSHHPRAIELRVSSLCFDGKESGSSSDEGDLYDQKEVGFAFVNIDKQWKDNKIQRKTFQTNVWAYDSQADFDQSGELPANPSMVPQKLSVEIEVTTEAVPMCQASTSNVNGLHHRRMLLYKHDEDMRQEMLAIQFLGACDNILKASGLDLKLKKYKCMPVGQNKGFIEWVPGALSLSELCKPMGQNDIDFSMNRKNHKTPTKTTIIEATPSDNGDDRASEEKSKAFVRTGGWCKYESLRALRQNPKTVARDGTGLSGDNPIQDFLRSNAFNYDAPYFIQKDVMDNFVKSCAGYCVITYLLGVGDRHTDNLLLHPEGHFLHCDYSFILGQDPKTYLPMRITSHMVNAMGGKESDNFAKFLSLAGAAFVALRRPAAVRVLMSLVQGMIHSDIPDVAVNQKPEEALELIHQRFCLDLNENDAVAFLEENIEQSLTSKIWIAVDAMHSFGKRF